MKTDIYSEKSNQLLISAIDKVLEQKRNAYRIHKHVELELGFILDGEATYDIGGDPVHVLPNSLILIRGNEQHCIPNILTPQFSLFNLHVSTYFLWNCCSEYIDTAKLHLLIGKHPIPHVFTEKEEYVKKIISLIFDPQKNRFIIRRTVMDLIASITEELNTSESTENNIETELVHYNEIDKIINFISEHLSEPITLNDIVSSTGYSRSRICSLFSNATGITPYEYLILKRIDKATELLRHTSDSILDIAFACGFGSLSNFNKSFRKITGLSPKEYRSSKIKFKL